jgi:cell division protein FtsI (penicillin-binding protein 3)
MLIKTIEEYEADHGCVVVMEPETGKFVLFNLGRANDTYYETTNYAVAESMNRDRLLN